MSRVLFSHSIYILHLSIRLSYVKIFPTLTSYVCQATSASTRALSECWNRHDFSFSPKTRVGFSFLRRKPGIQVHADASGGRTCWFCRNRTSRNRVRMLSLAVHDTLLQWRLIAFPEFSVAFVTKNGKTTPIVEDKHNETHT